MSYDYDYGYDYDEIGKNETGVDDQGEQLYLFQADAFERVIYLYICPILGIVTCILNAVVMSVLLRRNMRNNSTNIILMAISISDSLTGLITLPSYIAVFQQHATSSTPTNQWFNISSMDTSNMSTDNLDYMQEANDFQTNQLAKTPMDEYLLTENLCDGFMISKFFVLKTFHVVSVRLTLLLGFQRFLSFYKPLGMRREVTPFTIRRTFIICIAIFVTAPFLHIYHVFKDKSFNGRCKWSVDMGEDCGFDCFYFWLILLVENILPALILTLFTIYMIYKLIKPPIKGLTGVGCHGRRAETSVARRNRKQRKTSVMVIAVVGTFLAVEIPYAIFLLQNAIRARANLPLNLEDNRKMYAAYEVIMLLSFNANIFIYTIFNKNFRDVLKESITTPLCKVFRSKLNSKPRELISVKAVKPK